MIDLLGATREPAVPFKPLPIPGYVDGPRIPFRAPPPPKFGSRRVQNADFFAGGGGATNALEEALAILADRGVLPSNHSTIVDHAVNHDDAAIAIHETNHKHTKHYRANAWKVAMREALGDDFFGAFWLSPDCRDHSTAKGGPITSRSVRDLAWVLVKVLKELPDWQRPWSIYLENVGAFGKWSPLIPDGKGNYQRDKSREGETFDRFIRAVCAFGYTASWKEIVACEHGSPTIRKRLYIVFRRDLQRATWPAPTHGDPKSDAVKSGALQPWPVAADILDWSLDCPSIFMTKAEAREYTKRTGKRIIRPLAVKTHARLAYGVKRHVLDEGDEAFVVGLAHGDSGGRRWYGIDEPLTTVHAGGNNQGVVVPHVAVFRGDSVGKPVTDPLPTPTANSFIKRPGGATPLGVCEALAVPCIVGVGGRMGQSAPRSVGKPWQSTTTKPDSAICAAVLARMAEAPSGEGPWIHLPPVWREVALRDVDASVIAPFISRGQHGGGNRPATDPLHTIAASDGDQNQIVVPYLVPRYGERDGQEPRSIAIDRAMPTPVPDGNQGSLAAVYLAQHNNDDRRSIGVNPGRPADAPVSALTVTGSHQSVVAASMLSYAYTSNTNGGNGTPAKPAKTVLAGGNHANLVMLPLVSAYYGSGDGFPVDQPMWAATTHDRFGLLEADAAIPPLTDEQMARARQVAEFLRAHDCWDGGEIVTLTIKGIVYVIVDIGMRMLTPRELARAQDFPDSYVLDPIHNGKPLSETEQRHKIGNSVCRSPARAIIVENHRPPSWWGEQAFQEAAE